MKKYLIIVGVLCLGIIVFLVGLGKYSYLDTEYLFEWGRFKPIPEEIRQKHAATIDKIDTIITKESTNEVTSHSERFNLENYLGVIEIGVYPYIKSNDPFYQDVKLLIEDIREHLNKTSRKRY